MSLHEIQGRNRWGALMVYERRYYRRNKLPRYLVLDMTTDRAVKDCRTLREARAFARAKGGA